MLKRFLSLFSLFLLCFSSPLFSAPSSSPSPTVATSSPVTAKLISEEKSIQPGHPFWIGIELNMEKGWDTYWINPGDAGFPTNVTWHLPENFHVSSLHWPYPERFTSQSLVGFGYTHSAILLAEVTPPADLPAHDVTLSADVSWLACKDQCVPGNAHLQLTLPVVNTLPQKDDTVAAQFLKARERLPKPLPQNDESLSFAPHKETLLLNFKLPAKNFDIKDAFFVSETQAIFDHSAPQLLQKEKEGYVLNLKLLDTKKEMPNHVKGVLVLSEKGSDSKQAIQVDAKVSSASAAASDHQTHLKFEIALLCAFFGGLILNVMPCVLPVISLKVFSFIKMAQQKRGEILKQGILFTTGVVISFWALSALLLILRASGESIGWGFQLQEPMFVAILILVLFLLGLSLFGLFELGTSLMSMGEKVSSKGSFFKGSFMNGVLATLVATPCTGPLLGPALGLAMVLPPLSSLTIFTVMALGMASPYLIISAFPKLIRFLPKPGNWMIIFKQIMGFFMMATCTWLIWVYVGETDPMALFVLLFTLLLFSMGAWIYGKWANIGAKKKTRLVATIVSCLILTFGGGMALSTTHAHRQVEQAQVASQGEWQSFSTEKVNALRKEGKAVFVDFTAKWCLICQANKVTLHSAEIQKAFHENNVVPLEADWTKKDADITSMLHKLGRSGVPVYVLYPADINQPPHILPQTLTKSIVQDYIHKLDQTTVNAH